MRVLFVGNSYVYFNDLPGLLVRLAAAGGVTLEAESVAAGGMTLLGHLRHGEALARLRACRWDAVVLQEQSTRPSRAPALLRAAARPFAQECARVGARLLLLLTWARRGHPEQQTSLDAAYHGTARELGALVAPVGPAWQRALAERPDLPLHRPDGSHPAPAGTYLAACVLFAALTGRSPVGLGERTVLAGDGGAPAPLELSEAEAALLQRVAWETAGAAPDPSTGGTWPDGETGERQAGKVGAEPDPDLHVELLKEVDLLAGLTAPQIRKLLAGLGRQRVPAGTTLCAAGEVGETTYLALDGVVAITTAPGQTAQFDLGRLGLASALGMEGLLGTPYPATVTAAADMTLIAIRTADVDALAAREPALAAAIRRNLRPE